MIIKGSAHTGRGLAAHLLRADTNEAVRVLPGRHLVDDDIEAAVQQMQSETSGTRAKSGLIHVSASPDPRYPMRESDWKTVWALYEAEFGVSGRGRAGAEHRKDGRTHRHHLYQRIDPATGHATRLSNSYARHEYVARLAEYALGHEPTRGRWHIAVMRRLRAERPEVADWLEARLEPGAAPEAALSHNEWQQQERTGVDHRQVAALAAAAWAAADTGAGFESALAAQGLALADGDSSPQLVDAAGGTHDVRRTLRAAGARVRARDVRERLAELSLPTVDQVRAAQLERAAETPQTLTEDVTHAAAAADTIARRHRPGARRARPEYPRRGLAPIAEHRLRELSQCGLADPAADPSAPRATEVLLPDAARPARQSADGLQRPRASGGRAELTALERRERELTQLERERARVARSYRELRRRLATNERLVADRRRLPVRWPQYEPVRAELAEQIEALEPSAERARELRQRWGVFAWLSPTYWGGRRAERKAGNLQGRLEEHFEAAEQWADGVRGRLRAADSRLTSRRNSAAAQLLELDRQIAERAAELGVDSQRSRRQQRDAELAAAEQLLQVQTDLAREHRAGPAAALERLRSQAREQKRGQDHGHGPATSGRGTARDQTQDGVDFG